jgi:hypothetical protein
MADKPAYPIVQVRQQYGPPAEAELRETHPTRAHVVKVVYCASRTAAWIARSRIVDAALPAPPADDDTPALFPLTPFGDAS